jgi:hypothetical protein
VKYGPFAQDMGLFEKEKVFSNNYRPKDEKLKCIETTGIRKAMKEVLAKPRKAHRLGVTFFASNLCIDFSSQIMNKVP